MTLKYVLQISSMVLSGVYPSLLIHFHQGLLIGAALRLLKYNMEEKHQESTSGKVSMSLKNSSTSTLEVQDVTDPGHEEGFAVSPAAAEAVRRKSISIGPSKNGPSYWRRRTMVRPPVKGDPRERVSKLRKAAILAVVSQAGCLGGFSSTIYVSGNNQIKRAPQFPGPLTCFLTIGCLDCCTTPSAFLLTFHATQIPIPLIVLNSFPLWSRSAKS